LGIMWTSSDSLRPLSVNRAMIALTLVVSAFSIKVTTCSFVRLGSVGLPIIGADKPTMGLEKPYSVLNQR